MRRAAIGEVIFWGATAFALAVYWLTAPAGVPWHPVAAPNPLWRYCVAMAEGHGVVLSCLAAAVSGGLIGAIVNRYLGWRLGVASSLVWAMMPWVWNRAVTGDRFVCLAAAAVAVVWVVNAILLWVFRKARKVAKTEAIGGTLADHGNKTRRGKLNRIAGWVALGAAGLFAVASASLHDYRYGAAASVYARLAVEEAADRVILLNGLCDEQVLNELQARKGKVSRFSAISFSNADENRTNLVSWVKSEFPTETNLWLGAEISPAVFADFAVRAHPERFYSMMGHSTDPEKWAARWEAMRPYLASRDPFVPLMRRSFAYEGNVLGNACLTNNAEGAVRQAWNLYYRVFTEIEPNNPAASVNLNGLLRRGHTVDGATRQRVESAQAEYAKLLKDKTKVAQMAARLAHFGPIMRDQKAYEELRERVRKRMEELGSKDERPIRIPDLKTLEEWHAEMMKAFQARQFGKAARIARAILSRPAWRGFVPANMVLGESLMMRADWVAAEVFLRVAVEATGAAAPPPFVLNDYAETLRQLKRYAEAETHARKAVAMTQAEDGWVFRLTLAEIMRDQMPEGSRHPEVRTLVRDVLKHAPKSVRETIRKEFPR